MIAFAMVLTFVPLPLGPGLYPNGNDLPPAHAALAQQQSALVQPIDGKVVMLSVGMSNTTRIFCCDQCEPGPDCYAYSFLGRALPYGQLEIVDGAHPGELGFDWVSPTSANYDRIRDDELAPRGLTESQVQVIWMLQLLEAGPNVSLPEPGADAHVAVPVFADIVRSCKQRYPNLRLLFLSSRVYAGHANTPLHPEPYAYENGFTVKWLIEAQINQLSSDGAVDPSLGDLGLSAAPVLLWGPYLWNPSWEVQDYQPDGTHVAPAGVEKAGAQLDEFFRTSEFATPWYRVCGDCNGDASVDIGDAISVLNGETHGACDANDDGAVDIADAVTILDRVFGGAPPGCR